MKNVIIHNLTLVALNVNGFQMVEKIGNALVVLFGILFKQKVNAHNVKRNGMILGVLNVKKHQNIRTGIIQIKK